LTLRQIAQGQAFTECMPAANLQTISLISPLQSHLKHDKNLVAGGDVFPDCRMDRLALATDPKLADSPGAGHWNTGKFNHFRLGGM
jgi:hypothetical protein